MPWELPAEEFEQDPPPAWPAALAFALVAVWLGGMLWWSVDVLPTLGPVAMVQFVAALCVVPALVGIGWLLLNRTSRAEAQRFGASARRMRAEAAALERTVGALTNAIDVEPRPARRPGRPRWPRWARARASGWQALGHGITAEVAQVDAHARNLADVIGSRPDEPRRSPRLASPRARPIPTPSRNGWSRRASRRANTPPRWRRSCRRLPSAGAKPTPSPAAPRSGSPRISPAWRRPAKPPAHDWKRSPPTCRRRSTRCSAAPPTRWTKRARASPRRVTRCSRWSAPTRPRWTAPPATVSTRSPAGSPRSTTRSSGWPPASTFSAKRATRSSPALESGLGRVDTQMDALHAQGVDTVAAARRVDQRARRLRRRDDRSAESRRGDGDADHRHHRSRC